MCNKSNITLYDKLCYNLKNKNDVTRFKEIKNEIEKIVGTDNSKKLLFLAEAKEYSLFGGVSALCAFVVILMVFVNAYLSILLDLFKNKILLDIGLLIISILCVLGVAIPTKKLYENYKYKYRVIEILNDMIKNKDKTID